MNISKDQLKILADLTCLAMVKVPTLFRIMMQKCYKFILTQEM